MAKDDASVAPEDGDPETEVAVSVVLRGTLTLRMPLSKAKALNDRFIGQCGPLDVDDVDGFDWGDAVNMLDGEVDGVDFDE